MNGQQAHVSHVHILCGTADFITHTHAHTHTGMIIEGTTCIYPTAHVKIHTCLLVFSTVSCLSLADSLCRATRSLRLKKRK